MSMKIGADTFENNDFRVTTDVDGDMAFVHVPSGQTFKVDEDVTASDVIQTGDNASLTSLDADTAHSTQLTSKSLPQWRVYKDSGETVAIDESNTEIARSTDAATVWQGVCDEANNLYDPSFKEFPVVQIDGGGLRYNINSDLVIKSGAGVSNVKFDMANAGTSAQITVGGTDTGFSVGGGWLQTAEIYDPPQPIRFRDLVYAQLGPIYVRDAVGDGADFQSNIGCDININVKNSGGDGILFSDNGASGQAGNSNRVIARANTCGKAGIKNFTARNTLFWKAISENCTSHGIVDSGQGCIWVNPTTEVNDSYGFYCNASCGHYLSPHSAADTGGRFRFTGLSSECILRGPIRGNNKVDFAGTDIRVEDVNPEYIGSVEGTRILINGVGSNGSNDPSAAGDWNGNGWEGATVYWDDGAGNNFASKYMNGGWRQIASW